MALFLRFCECRSNPLILSIVLVMAIKNILLCGLSFLLLLSSCSKEVDELPPATQTGANTFGVKINGKNWVPARFGIVPATNLLEASWTGPESVIIYARNFSASPTETVFEIQISNLTGPGTYYFNQTITKPTGASYGYYVKRTITPEDEWQTSSQFTGSVNVTRFDRANHIISGTFEFNAGSLYHPDEFIAVTDGRFDVKFN